MKLPVYFLSVLLILVACGESNDQTHSADRTENTSHQQSTGNDSAAAPLPGGQNITGCYMRVLQRDTLAASLRQTGNTVTGKLTFDNYQKDGSTGTVNGTLEGNILKLTYSFQSEGMNSVMQVFFRLEDDGLIHGIGDVAMKGDTVVYKDPATISYATAEKLRKLPCDSLPAKYKD